MGTTSDFLKLRSTAKEIKLNQWHNNFSVVKKFAETNKVPLIAVWSNGDKCNNCKKFENCLMDSKFKTWMKTSQCAFWFGYEGDKSKEDRMEGTGFKWIYQNGKVTDFPFVRIYLKSSKIDHTESGKTLCGNSANGAATLVKNFKNILKNYVPEIKENKPSTDTCTDCEYEGTFTPPELSYEKNIDGTYKLLVNKGSTDRLSLEQVKYIVDKYNK